MPHPQFDRHRLAIKSLAERPNRIFIEKHHVPVSAEARPLQDHGAQTVSELVGRIKDARKNDRPVVLAFGAHAIKNGLGLILIELIREGWVTHLATNGAGIIHDWEFAFQGESSEDVRANVDQGQFGIWEETGRYINMALVIGAYRGLGYGESVGSFVENEGLEIPSMDELVEAAHRAETDSGACGDAMDVLKRFGLSPGPLSVSHPYKQYSVQAAAYRLNVPFTGHPMIGHDIIYTHPMNHGGAIGRTAMRDFLSYASAIERLEGGVYISIGSAVMSPMIFEKAFSMAQNVAIQSGGHIDNHYICVVDLAPAVEGWSGGKEPDWQDPSFYVRYRKTFSRMGGTMQYVCADNRDFLLTVYRHLQ